MQNDTFVLSFSMLVDDLKADAQSLTQGSNASLSKSDLTRIWQQLGDETICVLGHILEVILESDLEYTIVELLDESLLVLDLVVCEPLIQKNFPLLLDLNAKLLDLRDNLLYDAELLYAILDQLADALCEIFSVISNLRAMI